VIPHIHKALIMKSAKQLVKWTWNTIDLTWASNFHPHLPEPALPQNWLSTLSLNIAPQNLNTLFG
jgi:hypothetical protein